MKNRKLEIFLVLILGTKGKLLPRQKTQQIFLSSLKPVSPHLSHWARAQQSWGWHPSRAQGGDCWLWPSRKCTSFVLHGFPFSTCTCSVVVSGPLLTFSTWFQNGQHVQKLFRNSGGERRGWKDKQNTWNCCRALISSETYAKSEVLSPPLTHMHTYAKCTPKVLKTATERKKRAAAWQHRKDDSWHSSAGW